MLHTLAIILGTVALAFGFLLVFGFKQFQELSAAVNRVLLNDEQIGRYRISIGLVLIGSAILILVGSHYLTQAGY